MPCTNHPVIEDNLVKCSRCTKPYCQDCVVQLKSNYFCIDCKGEQVKDIQSGADATVLDLAGVGTRFAALFLDGLVLMIPLGIGIFILAFGFTATGSLSEAMVMGLGIRLIMLVIPLLYEGLMLQSRGQTLGKMACKVKVVTADGGDMSTGQAWGRTAAHVVMAQIPLVNLINYLFAFGKDKTCLHDKMAKTRVIAWNK